MFKVDILQDPADKISFFVYTLSYMETKYTPTIGLEIHAELKTKTKMFCNSKNDPDEKRPNVNICPVCMAHPGTLPVINKEAVKYVVKVGRAIGGEIADFTEFDRKNYFYPDIPKAYQISQYKFPLVSGGSLHGVHITRVHLEEDTARSQHAKDGNSLVDFNRAGVPLMELVTEPVIKSAKEAGDFARELQLLLSPLYLDVSEANMEKGEMRVEANISVSSDPTKFGTKVEVKNLNSFRAVEKAIEFEIDRQIKLLEDGGEVVQETRGFDDTTATTFSQRKKESSEDYRYFPDPDLPKLYLNEVAEFQDIELPELPAEKRARYAKDFGIKADDIEFFSGNLILSDLFENTLTKLGKVSVAQLLSNYITSDLVGLQKKGKIIMPQVDNLAEFTSLIDSGEVSSRGAKDILAEMVMSGKSPKTIATEKNLFQKSDAEELLKIIDQVIADNEQVVADFKNGNDKPLQFLIGQGMKLSKGSANPGLLAELFTKRLKN